MTITKADCVRDQTAVICAAATTQDENGGHGDYERSLRSFLLALRVRITRRRTKIATKSMSRSSACATKSLRPVYASSMIICAGIICQQEYAHSLRAKMKTCVSNTMYPINIKSPPYSSISYKPLDKLPPDMKFKNLITLQVKNLKIMNFFRIRKKEPECAKKRQKRAQNPAKIKEMTAFS